MRYSFHRHLRPPQFLAAALCPAAGGHDSEAVAEACRSQLDRIVEPVLAVQYVTALGKRKLLFDLLPDAMEAEKATEIFAAGRRLLYC